MLRLFGTGGNVICVSDKFADTEAFWEGLAGPRNINSVKSNFEKNKLKCLLRFFFFLDEFSLFFLFPLSLDSLVSSLRYLLVFCFYRFPFPFLCPSTSVELGATDSPAIAIGNLALASAYVSAERNRYYFKN